LLLHAAGRAWIAAIATSHTGFERLATPLILSGAGIAVVMPTVSHESIGSVPASYVGVASGINSIRELGGVFGVALLADIFTRPDVSTDPAASRRSSPPPYGPGRRSRWPACWQPCRPARVAGEHRQCSRVSPTPRALVND
jgi:hypothetical protein